MENDKSTRLDPLRWVKATWSFYSPTQSPCRQLCLGSIRMTKIHLDFLTTEINQLDASLRPTSISFGPVSFETDLEKEMEQFFQAQTALCEIMLSGQTSQGLLSHLKCVSKVPQIQRLIIHNVPLPSFELGCLVGQIVVGRQRLELHNCLISFSFVNGFYSAIAKGTSPQLPLQLLLPSCHINDSIFSALAQGISQEHVLQELRLSNNSLTSASIPLLTSLLRRHCHSLQTVDLSDFDFGVLQQRSTTTTKPPGVWNDFLKALGSLNCLKALDLSWCKMDYGMPTHILERLDGLSRLSFRTTRMFVRCFDDESNPPSTFFQLVSKNQSLRHLDLSGCRMGNEHVRLFLVALQRNKTLQRLSLKLNNFSVNVLSDCSPFKESCHLQHIDLPYQYCKNRKDWDTLLKALNRNTSLTSITMGATSIRASVQELLERNKNIHKAHSALRGPLYRQVQLWPELFVQLSSSTKNAHNASALYTFCRGVAMQL